MDLASGTIDTYAGTGVAQPTSDGAPVAGTPLNGPRTMVLDERRQICISRCGKGMRSTALRPGHRRCITWPEPAKQGFSGDGGPARAAELAGPKGLAYGSGSLFVADTENHVIRKLTSRPASSRRYLARASAEMVPKPIR